MVISGYLITSIIIKENENNIFSLKSFWVRRIKRIIPALTVVTITILGFKYWLLFRADIESTAYQSLATLFSYANIYLWKLTRNYWGIQPEDTLFLHTWSLSLEEQFYIIYPVLVVLVLKRSIIALKYFCLALCIVGFIFFAIYCDDKPQASFYLLPFRFWELLIGCTAASFQASTSKLFSKSHSPLIGWIGFSTVVASFFLIDSENDIGPSLLFPTIGTVLVLIKTAGSSYSVKRILSNLFITYIGKISYSLYLWHWPLIFFYEHFNINSNFLYAVSLLFVSSASYFFIEKPARLHPKSLPIIVITFCLTVIFSLYIIKNQGKYDTSSFNKTYWSGMNYNFKNNGENHNEVVLNEKFLGVEFKIVDRKNDYIDTNKSTYLYILGDSHSLMWSEVIDDISKENNLTTNFFGTDGKFPYVEFYENKLEDNNFLKDEYGETFGIKEHSLVIISALWSFEQSRVDSLKKLLKYLQELKCQIILIEQPPILYFGNHSAPQYLSFLGYHPPSESKIYIPVHSSDNWSKGKKVIQSIKNNFERCSVIETSDLLLKENKALVIFDNSVLYIDDDHLSLAGSTLFKERIKDSILKEINILQNSED